MEGCQEKTHFPVIILGGGIHGVGVAHDLATRHIESLVLEKTTVGMGTSSKSTKLIHGGLRYLENFRDFSLVAEALRERKLLSELLPDLVKPVELLFPVSKLGGLPPWKVKIGLGLYDFLAGKNARIQPFSEVSLEEARARVPVLDTQKFKRIFSFWDAQTDDLALTQRVAVSAQHLGATIKCGSDVLSLEDRGDHWGITVKHDDLSGTKTYTSTLVVNCLGPWAGAFLEKSGLPQQYRGVNNKGTHIVLQDFGLKAGIFIQSPADGRVVFLLPWQGYTLLGTTEDLYQDEPDKVAPTAHEVEYLLSRSSSYLTMNLTERDILYAFSGLRWLAAENDRSLTRLSRSYHLDILSRNKKALMTLYGGKLTTYRSTSEDISSQICRFLNVSKDSLTGTPEAWFGQNTKSPGVDNRFVRYSGS